MITWKDPAEVDIWFKAYELAINKFEGEGELDEFIAICCRFADETLREVRNRRPVLTNVVQ